MSTEPGITEGDEIREEIATEGNLWHFLGIVAKAIRTLWEGDHVEPDSQSRAG